MNILGRFTAAVGSVALNVALALILSQGAGAATPSTNAPVAGPEGYIAYQDADYHAHQERCAGGIRTRVIAAVVLALIV